MLVGTVLCLGDSLTFGARAEVGTHAGLGYPEHLAAMLTGETGEAWGCLNRGISGQTVRQVADRAPGAVREVCAYPGPRWVCLLAGTNDSKHPGVPLAEWEVLYEQAAGWARRASLPLALATFPPVSGGAMPVFGPRSAAWLDAASDRVRAMATEWDGVPSPVVLVELADMPTALLCDGVHLTPAGYRAVAGRFLDAMLYRPARPWPELVDRAAAWLDAAAATRASWPGGEEVCVAEPVRPRRRKTGPGIEA